MAAVSFSLFTESVGPPLKQGLDPPMNLKSLKRVQQSCGKFLFFYFSLYIQINYISDFRTKPLNITGINFAKNKTKLALWMVSNCKDETRLQYFAEISKHMEVDVNDVLFCTKQL